MKPENILSYSQALGVIGRPIAYYPNIGKALRNQNATILICQFIYWEGKQHAGPGTHIKKGYPEIMEETGLTESQIDNGRKCLKELGIAWAVAKGNPAKLHWSFDWGKLDKVLHDWFILENGAAFAQAPAPETPDPPKEARGVPKEIYNQAVALYFDFCQNPKRMGKKPMFGPAQGKTMKDLLTYLKGVSITPDWEGALTMLEYLFLSWDTLTEHYRKQVDLLDIRRNINNILGLINNTANNGTPRGKNANRVSAQAATGY